MPGVLRYTEPITASRVTPRSVPVFSTSGKPHADGSGMQLLVDGGAADPTVHVREAGDGSVLPTASVARTPNACEPLLSPEYAFGDTHELHVPPSRRQVNDEPDSVDAKEKLAESLATVPVGPDAIVVS